MTRILKWMTLAMGALMAAGPAVAQDTRSADRDQADTFRPAEVPGYTPDARTPEYSSSMMRELEQPRDMSLPGLARQYMVDGLAIQWLQAELEVAQRQARSVLLQLYGGVRSDSHLGEAQERLRQAQNNFDRVRAQAMRELQDDAAYREGRAEQAALEERIAQVRQMGISQAQIADLAEAKLQSAGEMSAMERQVLRRNQAYEAAREQLVRANLEHERLLDRLNAAVPNHPLYASAVERAEDLERRLAVQWIDFAGTSAAYAQALENQAIQFEVARRFGYGRYGYGRVGGGWSAFGPAWTFTGVNVGWSMPVNR